MPRSYLGFPTIDPTAAAQVEKLLQVLEHQVPGLFEVERQPEEVILRGELHDLANLTRQLLRSGAQYLPEPGDWQ